MIVDKEFTFGLMRLEDNCMKIYIIGMSDSKKDIERYMGDHTKQIVLHLAKLLLLRGHSASSHWKKEIASQIFEVSKLKKTNKFPTKDQLYKWTYGKVQDLVTDKRWITPMIETIAYEYDTDIFVTPRELSNLLDHVCVDYFQWLSSSLAVSGQVSFPAIYRKIDELLIKHHCI